PAGGYRQSGEQMGFAGAAVAYKDDGLGPPDIAALGELVNPLRRDAGRLREVELVEGLQPRQMRFAKAPRHQPLLAFLQLGLQQRFEITQMRAAFAHRLFRQRGALRGDGRQMQKLALLADGGCFQDGGLRIHDTTSWPSSAS